MASSVARGSVGSYPAFPPLPGLPGGIFLLHCLWSRLHRTLSGTLPCEARTFLSDGLSAPGGAIIYPTLKIHVILAELSGKVKGGPR